MNEDASSVHVRVLVALMRARHEGSCADGGWEGPHHNVLCTCMVSEPIGDGRTDGKVSLLVTEKYCVKMYGKIYPTINCVSDNMARLLDLCTSKNILELSLRPSLYTVLWVGRVSVLTLFIWEECGDVWQSGAPSPVSRVALAAAGRGRCLQIVT